MTLGPIRFTNASGGTANFVYPGPTIDMQSPATAGAADATTYLIYAQTFDMTQWEVSTGAYTLSSGTFARTTIKKNSLGTTAKINFGTPPQVFVFDNASAGAGALLAANNLSDVADAPTSLTNLSGVSYAAQTLTGPQQLQALANISGVSYTAQTLTGPQQAQARANIGVSASGLPSISTVVANTGLSAAASQTVLVDASGGAVTITLFAASGPNSGSVANVKKIDTSANNVIVVVSGGANIDDTASVAISAKNARISVQCDSTQWWQI